MPSGGWPPARFGARSSSSSTERSCRAADKVACARGRRTPSPTIEVSPALFVHHGLPGEMAGGIATGRDTHQGARPRTSSTLFFRRGCQRGCQNSQKDRISRQIPCLLARIPRYSGEPAGIRTQDTRIKSLSGRRPWRRSGASCERFPRGSRPPTPPGGTGCDRRGWQRGWQESGECGDRIGP